MSASELRPGSTICEAIDDRRSILDLPVSVLALQMRLMPVYSARCAARPVTGVRIARATTTRERRARDPAPGGQSDVRKKWLRNISFRGMKKPSTRAVK
eukprot:COSAG02_NODE_3533_length_6604_cov_5.986472_1_plen_99_part_00